MRTEETIFLRAVTPDDLESVNTIVESCVMGWNLPERVKRLSLGSYRYHVHDIEHFEMVLATLPGGETAGVAAWEPATFPDIPAHKTGMLLHGLYVAPRYQRQGIGSRLMGAALDAVRSQKMDGLLVKAQADAVGYFQSRDFVHLPVESADRDYPHRWWKPV